MKQMSKEMKKSFIGAFLGGLVGYLLGYLAGSVTFSYILIFAIGYLGYDIRQVIEKTKEVSSKAWKEFWGFYTVVVPYPKTSIVLTLVLIPLSILFFLGSHNSGVTVESNPAFWSHFCVYGWSTIVWSFTGDNFMGGDFYVGSLVTRLPQVLGMSFATLLAVLVVVPCSLWIVKGLSLLLEKYRSKEGYFWPLTNSVKFIAQKGAAVLAELIDYYEKLRDGYRNKNGSLWKFVLVFLFVCALFPLILLAKGVVLILKGIHSWRRLVCALSALTGGILYITVLPFTIQSIPTIVLAVGCGLVCGGISAAVMYVLDDEKISNQLESFVQRPTKDIAFDVVTR